MKVLVTGATGHLGTNLVRCLLSEGREVRALVRATSPREELDRLDVECVEGDLLDPDSLRRALNGCVTVYHAAAVYKMWASDPETITRPTVEGSRYVLQLSHEQQVSRVVYVSTVGTIGFTNDPDRPVDETQFNRDPHTPYLRAKCRAEAEARAFQERTGLPIVFVNPGVIMGPHFTRVTPSVQYVLDYLLRGAPVTVRTGVSIVDAEDVARGAILAEKRGKDGERYLLGGANLTMRAMYDTLSALTGLPRPGPSVPDILLPSVARLAEAVGRITGKAPRVSREMVRDFRGRYIFVSSEKARRELGYRYLEPEEVLRRTIEWLLKRGFVPERRRTRIALEPGEKRLDRASGQNK